MTVEMPRDGNLRERLRGALDLETGPDSVWSESPAARQVAERERTRTGRRSLPRLLAIAAILLIGGVTVVGGGALLLRQTRTPPTPPMSNGLVAYSFGSDLYVAADVTEPRRIAGSDGDRVDQICPRFSADGTTLAYAEVPSESAGAAWRIMVADVGADGNLGSTTIRIELPNAPLDRCFVSSADNHLFAYYAQTANGGDVRVANRDGDLVTAFAGPEWTSGAQPEATRIEQFAFSPDATTIAVVKAFGSSQEQQFEIWIAATDEPTKPRLLLREQPNRLIDTIAWSPDGNRLAFGGSLLSVEIVGGAPSIGSQGRFARVVSTAGSAGPADEIEQWSEIEGFDSYGGPEWAPDGSAIAYLREGVVVVADSDGRNPRVLPPVDVPPGVRVTPVRALHWSPDGKRLLFIGADRTFIDRGTRYVLVAVDAAGSASPAVLMPWTEPRSCCASVPIGMDISWQGVRK